MTPSRIEYVANGVYCFQNIVSGPCDYLTLKPTGQVQGAKLDDASDTQQWTVSKRKDGHYDIANLGTSELLAVSSPAGKELSYTLSVKGDIKMSWDLVANGSKLMIKASAQFSSKAVNLVQERIVLSDVNDRRASETWIATAAPPPPPTSPTWITLRTGDTFPANAVKGGKDYKGRDMYVARAKLVGDSTVRAGNALPTLNSDGSSGCLACFNDDKTEVQYDTFDVFVASVKWVSCTLDQLNSTGINSEGTLLKPVVLGYFSSILGDSYIVRMSVDNILSVGTGNKNQAKIGDLKGHVVLYKVPPPTNTCEVLCYD